MKVYLVVAALLFISLLNGHLTDNDNDKHKHSFETINKEAFPKRVIGVNYTQETINGKRVKYYITDTGDWHLDSCTVIGKEGDGLLGTYRRLVEQDRRRRLNPLWAKSDDTGQWENGYVPYVMAHSNIIRENWDEAVRQYEQYTPVRWVEITDTTDINYVRVVGDQSGCFSSLGMVNRQWVSNYNGQTLSLGPGCDGSLSTIMHEMGHTMGFYHTQSRSDRNEYVTVVESNIQEGAKSQYEIVDEPICGFYDCTSMMHYFDYAFSKCGRNCKTLISKSPTCVIDRNDEYPLSTNDRACLCKMYEPGSNGYPSSECGGTDTPTKYPTLRPSVNPTKNIPTIAPSKKPTVSPVTQPPTISPVPTTAPTGFCLTGRAKTSKSNLFIVGYWVEQPFPDDNGNTYYKNQRTSCYQEAYIYQTTAWSLGSDSQWTQDTVFYMSTTLGSTTYYARCKDSDVYNCDQKWEINGGIDTNLRLTVGPCITPECETLILSTNEAVGNTECDGGYTKVATNKYEKNSGTHILEFNDYYEKWRCYIKSWDGQINQCNYYTGLQGESSEGISPVLTKQDTIYDWSGGIGAQAVLKCGTLVTPTPPPVLQVSRPFIDCSIRGLTVPIGTNQEINYDFVAPANNYAIVFYTCYSSTTVDTTMKITSQNLINELPSVDYSQYHCSATPGKMSLVFFEHDYANDFTWIDGQIYTLTVSAVGGNAGEFTLGVFCQADQQSALNFGKNDEGEVVSIFSFKNYGSVQWSIFFGVLIAIIILNIVSCYFIIKCMLKKKSQELEQKLNDANNNTQTNIQLANDYDDGFPTGTR